MAKNVWGPGSFDPAAASATVAAKPRTVKKPAVKTTGMPPTYPSLWRSPRGELVNPITRALTNVGGNAVTNALGPAPATPGSPGGGGRGGGGGGGGGPAITQAMIDAMAQALGMQGPQLQYQDLPAFQGQQLGAFNPAPYNTQRGLVDQALAADQANFNTNQQATTQAVQGAYSNPYANAQVTAGSQMAPQGAGLLGGMASPNAANQVNADNTQNQGTFQDLFSVLAANQQASQNSRMQQVAMDANYGRQQAGAQATGLQGGIANNQAMAQQQWQQQQAERDYQNQLMAQQWAMQNAQARQATQQANWTQNNAALQSRLQPILDLISQTGGSSGLNLAPLMAALQGAGAR